MSFLQEWQVHSYRNGSAILIRMAKQLLFDAIFMLSKKAKPALKNSFSSLSFSKSYALQVLNYCYLSLLFSLLTSHDAYYCSLVRQSATDAPMTEAERYNRQGGTVLWSLSVVSLHAAGFMPFLKKINKRSTRF